MNQQQAPQPQSHSQGMARMDSWGKENNSLYARTIYSLIESSGSNEQLQVIRMKVAEYYYMLGYFIDPKRANDLSRSIIPKEAIRQRYIETSAVIMDKNKMLFPDEFELSNASSEMTDKDTGLQSDHSTVEGATGNSNVSSMRDNNVDNEAHDDKNAEKSITNTVPQKKSPI